MIAAEQPGYDPGKTGDTNATACYEYKQGYNIYLTQCIQYKVVFTHQQQNKAPRNTGQDHSTDGYHPAYEYKPVSIRRFYRNSNGNIVRNTAPGKKKRITSALTAVILRATNQVDARIRPKKKDHTSTG